MKLIQIIKERKLLKIDKRIAYLEAKVAFWITKQPVGGGLPRSVYNDIAEWKGEIAALTTEKNYYANT
jgi:hypothetical protein